MKNKNPSYGTLTKGLLEVINSLNALKYCDKEYVKDFQTLEMYSLILLSKITKGDYPEEKENSTKN